MKYRKKPVEVEAIQFLDTVDNLTEIFKFAGENNIRVNYKDPYHPVLKIKTLEGIMRAEVGDYIIRGVHGELYPCKPDIFHETYERI